jgi:hypothetical protein
MHQYCNTGTTLKPFSAKNKEYGKIRTDWKLPNQSKPNRAGGAGAPHRKWVGLKRRRLLPPTQVWLVWAWLCVTIRAVGVEIYGECRFGRGSRGAGMPRMSASGDSMGQRAGAVRIGLHVAH